MKIYRFLAALVFLGAVAISPIFAQPKPAPQTPTSTTPSTNAVPDSKIGLINSDLWADEKQGIVRLVAASKRVDNEFQPRRTELQQLQQRMSQLNDEITKQQAASSVVDPRSLQTKMDQLEQLKKDAQRKQEDAQAAYNKRMQEVLDPIYDDLGKALDAFGKSRGITLMLDVSKIRPAILMASDATDVTRAFIADFNSKYPATAAVTSPK
jgi:outer membrane protein